jgi:hypothetical protein
MRVNKRSIGPKVYGRDELPVIRGNFPRDRATNKLINPDEQELIPTVRPGLSPITASRYTPPRLR